MRNLPATKLASLCITLTFGTFVYGADPKVKVLSAAEDVTQKTVLIGCNLTDNTLVTFELEAAKSMWMKMGGRWIEHRAGKGDIFQAEVKPVDPSQTLVSPTPK